MRDEKKRESDCGVRRRTARRDLYCDRIESMSDYRETMEWTEQERFRKRQELQWILRQIHHYEYTGELDRAEAKRKEYALKKEALEIMNPILKKDSCL